MWVSKNHICNYLKHATLHILAPSQLICVSKCHFCPSCIKPGLARQKQERRGAVKAISISQSIWEQLLVWVLVVEGRQQWGWPASRRARRRNLILQMVVWAIILLSGHHPGAPWGLMWSSCRAAASLRRMQAPVQAGGMGKEEAELWPSTSNAWQCFREQQGSGRKPLDSPCRAWVFLPMVLLWDTGVRAIPMPGQWPATHRRQFQ